jgi:hypothetical protein
MTTARLPRIDRKIPKWRIRVIAAIFYGIFVPLNWILSKLGREAALVGLMTRGPGGKKFDRVFKVYKPTPHDVFVSTFAKSGTNWMMQIAHQIAFRGAGDYEHIHDVISWPDFVEKGRRRIAISIDDERVQKASPTGLRVVKTHLAADFVPYSEAARYLVVVRDPKEIFVSSYFFAAGAAGPIMPSPAVWFELFLTDKFPLNFGRTWAEHTAGYWALKDKPNVLVLSFRAMKRDLPGAVRQVAERMGIDLAEAEMNAVVKKSTFQYMRGIENKFTPMPKDMLPWGEGLQMMRSGETGNSNEMLTLEQQRMIDRHFQAELARLGSDFPYTEFFQLAG